MLRANNNCQSLLIATPPPCSAPNMTNSDVRPCQIPIRKKVTKKQKAPSNGCITVDEIRRIKAMSSGLNTYVFSQLESVICHLFQKSRNEEAEKGRSKFSGSRSPINRASAMTMSIYPEKFK